jgi:hypothetical protein
MLNGIEMVCEMASEDSDWSFMFPPPIEMAFERLQFVQYFYDAKTEELKSRDKNQF